MTVADLAIIAGLVFAWGTLSARLEHFDMTAPIMFTAAGVLLTHGPLTPLGVTPSSEVVNVLSEATLALVLFSDASRVGLHQRRADLGLCLWLLGIGLPLAIGLGTLLAFILPGVTNIWFALLVGAALAPTDAALSAGAIATPFVLVAIAGATTAEHAASTGPGAAVAELALGLLIGVAVGGGGGWLVKVGRRGWVAEGFACVAVLSLTVIRMLPVAVALAGARLGRPAVLFVGWFGPRGLASVVFGLLALEDLTESAAKPAVTCPSNGQAGGHAPIRSNAPGDLAQLTCQEYRARANE